VNGVNGGNAVRLVAVANKRELEPYSMPRGEEVWTVFCKKLVTVRRQLIYYRALRIAKWNHGVAGALALKSAEVACKAGGEVQLWPLLMAEKDAPRYMKGEHATHSIAAVHMCIAS